MTITTLQPPMTHAQFTKIQVATLRDQQRSVTSTVRQALEAAGLEDATALKFERTNDHVLVGKGLPYEVDGRAEPMARNLRHEGNDIRTVIPPHGLDHLGLGDVDVDETPTQVDIWIANGDQLDQPLVAITPHIQETMSVDVSGVI